MTTSTPTNAQDQHGNWVFITPVSGLTLTKAVNYEFKINRVVFATKDKLPRIRKRLGIAYRISEYKRHYGHTGLYKEVLESPDTFAIVRHSGTVSELKTRCLRQVKEELAILAVSQLGYAKRRFGAYPRLMGENPAAGIRHIFLNSDDFRFSARSEILGKPKSLTLDGRWYNFQRKVFFYQLLNILNNKKKVAPHWRDDIRTAAILIGQSFCSTDIAQSFLWNVIALETLLTKQSQDRFTDILPKRIEAFIGWVGFWQTKNYQEKIQEIYKKRSRFVHQGDRSSITVTDLLFTDDLLLNVLMNLVNHTDIFGSKEKVIRFARKVEAEHLLGLKSKVRPKTLRFISPKYTAKDKEEILW